MWCHGDKASSKEHVIKKIVFQSHVFNKKKSTCITLKHIYKLWLQTLEADRNLYVKISEYSCKNKNNKKVFLLLIRRNGNIKLKIQDSLNNFLMIS